MEAMDLATPSLFDPPPNEPEQLLPDQGSALLYRYAISHDESDEAMATLLETVAWHPAFRDSPPCSDELSNHRPVLSAGLHNVSDDRARESAPYGGAGSVTSTRPRSEC